MVARGMKFNIEKIGPEDIPYLSKLHAQSWLDTYANADLGVSRHWLKAYTAQWNTGQGLKDYQEYFNR